MNDFESKIIFLGNNRISKREVKNPTQDPMVDWLNSQPEPTAEETEKIGGMIDRALKKALGTTHLADTVTRRRSMAVRQARWKATRGPQSPDSK